MADYTLSVEINGDASDLEEAFKSVTGKLKDSNKEMQKAPLGIGGMAKAFGVAQVAIKGASMALNSVRNSVDSAVSRVDTLNQYPKVLEQMGYSSDEARSSIDRLSDGIQGLPTRLDDIAGTTQRMTTIMGDIPKATESTLALNDAFLASGASQADASRGLEQYMQMLSAGKVDMQAWKTLQETMPYALQRTAEAFGFTGESAQKDFYQALKDGDITMAQFNDKLVELNQGTEGWHNTALEATKGIRTSMENVKTAVVNGVANMIQAFNDWANDRGFGSVSENIDKIKEAIKGAFSTMVERLPAVLDGIAGLASAIKRVWDWIGPLQPLVIGLIGALAGFGVVVSIVTKVTSAITGMSLAIKGITAGVGVFAGLKTAVIGLVTAFKGLWVVLLANPITLVIGAVVALGVAFVYAYNKFDGFRSFVDSGVASIKGFFISLVETIKGLPQAFSELWQGITTGIESAWSGVIEFFRGVWENITTPAVEKFTIFAESLSGIWDGIKMVAEGAWLVIKSVVLGPVLLLISLLTMNWQQLGSDLAFIWNGIKEGASLIWTALSTGVISIVTGLKDNAIALFENLRTSSIQRVEGLKTGAITKFEQLKTNAINAVNNLKNGFVSKVEEIKNSSIQKVNKLKDDFIRAIGQIPGKVFGFLNTARTHFNNLRNINLWDIGKAIINSLWNGLKSAWGGVANWLSSLGGQIRNLKGPIEKDRKLLIPEGRAIMESLFVGLEDGFGKVENQVGEMAGEIKKAMEDIGGSIDIEGMASVVVKRKNIDEWLQVGHGAVNEGMNELYGRVTRNNNVDNDGSVRREIGDLNLTVTTELDGKEVSRGTYKYDKQFIERETKFNNRRRGDV